MIEGVTIKELKKFTDDRGWLVETFRTDELPDNIGPVMSYVSMTKPGVARGPHEHKDQTDIFVFIGPGMFELHLWDNRLGSSTYGKYETFRLGAEAMAAVVVPPGIVHGYKNIGSDEAWCLNYPDRLYAGAGKKEEVDEIRHEQDSASKFIIK